MRLDWRDFVGPNYQKVSCVLYGAWQAGQGIFAEKDLESPEQTIYQWPEVVSLSAEKRIWVTIALGPLLRGTINTRTAVSGFRRILIERPAFLDRKSVSRMDKGELEQFFKKIGLGAIATQAAHNLIWNASVLQEQKSLAALLASLHSFHEALFVLGIPRYAEPFVKKRGLTNLGLLGFASTGKVLALVLAMLMDQDLMPRFLLPVSADIHYLRQMLATQAIVIPKRSSVITAYSLARIAREMSLELVPENLPYFNEEVSIASYVLGNKVCSKHPEMTANPILLHMRKKTVGGRYTPINSLCRLATRSRDLGKCSKLCPIEEYCSQIVPSGPYHAEGYLAPVKVLRRVLRPKGLV